MDKYGILSIIFQGRSVAENKEVVRFALPVAKGGSEK